MEMPKNWNNHSGWNAYYQSLAFDPSEVGKYELEDALRYLFLVLNSPGQSVWISGCGRELSPWLLARLGCVVTATDVAPAAIEFQQSLLKLNPLQALEALPEILEALEVELSPNFRSPELQVQDFRFSAPGDQYEVILNRKALQGLPQEDMEAAAGQFHSALAPGGTLIAETLNLQGADRTRLENACLKAGFFLPQVRANQWFRTQLDATGILYAMILGRPIIPQWGQYEDKGGEVQRKKDQAHLHSFFPEYRQRLAQNNLEDQQNYREGIDKMACILYNTG